MSIYAGALLVGISLTTWTDFNPWMNGLLAVSVVLLTVGLIPDEPSRINP